jgi:hypothetical protein
VTRMLRRAAVTEDTMTKQITLRHSHFGAVWLITETFLAQDNISPTRTNPPWTVTSRSPQLPN